VPDAAAQLLRTGTTKLLGVVISSITNPIYSRIVSAITEQAHSANYDIVIAHTLNTPEREEDCIVRLLSRRVDGLLIAPVYRIAPEARIFNEISARGTPTVILGHTAPFCRQFANVVTDDLIASYRATQHLLKLGHKRIAFFTGRMVAPWSQERLEGYRRALREAGIVADDKLVFEAGSTIEDGKKAALQMLNEGCHATAIQCVNDLVAIGGAETLMSQGLKIPEDVSVMGYGNILLAEHFLVPLTTVRQPKFTLGVTAMEMMLKMLRGEPVNARRLPAEVCVRASTAAPKKA
jgi:DNA-binding LacI/PurR family transcriptional regulator